MPYWKDIQVSFTNHNLTNLDESFDELNHADRQKLNFSRSKIGNKSGCPKL